MARFPYALHTAFHGCIQELSSFGRHDSPVCHNGKPICHNMIQGGERVEEPYYEVFWKNQRLMFFTTYIAKGDAAL